MDKKVNAPTLKKRLQKLLQERKVLQDDLAALSAVIAALGNEIAILISDLKIGDVIELDGVNKTRLQITNIKADTGWLSPSRPEVSVCLYGKKFKKDGELHANEQRIYSESHTKVGK